MSRSSLLSRLCAAGALFLMLGAGAAGPEAVATIKLVKGAVHVERGTQTFTATVGAPLFAADTLVTGADAGVGITFQDNSLLSLGPESRWSIDRFGFDRTTHDGRFESTLSTGRLAVVSGRIAKRDKQAMTIRTPSSLLGVRGTEFVVEVDE